MNDKHKFQLEKMQLTQRDNMSLRERIEAFYIEGKIELTEEEEIIRQRWSLVMSLLNSGKSPSQTVSFLKRHYKIKEAQAYRDVKDASKVYGDVGGISKEATRNILYEFSMKVYQLAAKREQFGEMNKAVANMIKIKGLEHDENNAPDFSMIQNNQFNISLDPKMEELFMGLGSDGTIDVTEFIKGNDKGA